MGDELTSTTVRIGKFLGINQRIDQIEIDPKECVDETNYNITDEALERRKGSTKLNSTAFKEKTSTTPVPITGMYQTLLNGSSETVGIGGDAIRENSSTWNDITGSVTITSDATSKWTFSTFLDGAVAEVIIASNGVNPPIKWTGIGNANALATPPGNFKFQVVHKNKLWVSIGDIVYFSALRNGESWDLANDLVRFQNNGEEITGLAVYNDRVIVFQETRIYAISGSSNRDLFVQTVVTGEGCISGYSLQEVESRRYGNILIFLAKDGVVKGFNGSKNLLQLGEPAIPLFKTKNLSAGNQATSGNYRTLGQYWLSLIEGSGTTSDVIVLYDYRNDVFNSQTGRQLSSILRHDGINANSMAVFDSSGLELLVTGDYNGFALRQDFGLLDEDANTISSIWQSGRLGFGSVEVVKLLADFHMLTTQASGSDIDVTLLTGGSTGTASISIAGGLWGTGLWGTMKWVKSTSIYSRLRMTPDNDRGLIGRFMQILIEHTTASQTLNINELVISVSSLGIQPEFVDV